MLTCTQLCLLTERAHREQGLHIQLPAQRQRLPVLHAECNHSSKEQSSSLAPEEKAYLQLRCDYTKAIRSSGRNCTFMAAPRGMQLCKLVQGIRITWSQRLKTLADSIGLLQAMSSRLEDIRMSKARLLSEGFFHPPLLGSTIAQALWRFAL